MSKPMTKTQLVAALAEEMDSDKKTAGAALDAVNPTYIQTSSAGIRVGRPTHEIILRVAVEISDTTDRISESITIRLTINHVEQAAVSAGYHCNSTSIETRPTIGIR